MAIPLTADPCGPPYEHCCFCFRLAKHWYAPKDVPVCESCAETHTADEVPSKEVWCDEVDKRFPHYRRY